MKKILVPTDFSEHSLFAARVAADIARKTQARIYFLHVIDMPVYDTNTGLNDYYDIGEGLAIMTLVKKRFAELFAMDFLDGINAGEVLQFSGVHENVTQQAEKYEIDLIVMGSHGASGWNEFFVGSNTEKIVRYATCPVLTVKKEHRDFNPQRIVYASGFMEEEEAVFEKVQEFSGIFGAAVHLLKVNTPAEFETTGQSMERLRTFADRHQIAHEHLHIYNAIRVEEGILEFSKDCGADMIALATHGRTGIAHFFGGSIAADLVNHSKRPVFTVKLRQEGS